MGQQKTKLKSFILSIEIVSKRPCSAQTIVVITQQNLRLRILDV